MTYVKSYGSLVVPVVFEHRSSNLLVASCTDTVSTGCFAEAACSMKSRL